MKSIKPGRGPSGMNFIGSIVAVVFGLFWTAMASKADPSGIFPIFGILFVILGIVQAVYHYKNTTSKNRYSLFDITSDSEESDPLNERFGQISKSEVKEPSTNTKYCPYCGQPVSEEFIYCNSCGKKLPKGE